MPHLDLYPVIHSNSTYNPCGIPCTSHFIPENGRCYGSPGEKKTWEEARRYCREIDENYDLVAIGNEDENDFVIDQIVSPSRQDEFWIGLKEDGRVGHYVWVDSTPFGFGSDFDDSIWVGNEPNSVIT